MKLTPEQFLKQEIDMGIHINNPMFHTLAKSTVQVVQDLQYTTVLDYGAGTGVYSKAFIDAKKDVSSFDIWETHVNYMRENIPEIKIVNEPITTDLMLFIEVAEHMTDGEIKTLFSKIEPKYILFSSTPNTADNDEEWGHINLKQHHEWVELFGRLGYTFERPLFSPTSWAKLFVKNG